MLIIRENKLLAAILGGLVVMSLLVIILKSFGGSDSNLPAAATEGTAGAGSAATPRTSAEQFSGPNIDTLDCGTLLSSDAIQDALGGVDSWSQVSRGENCVAEAPDNPGVFVQIQPGHPNDFAPGATPGAVLLDADPAGLRKRAPSRRWLVRPPHLEAP